MGGRATGAGADHDGFGENAEADATGGQAAVPRRCAEEVGTVIIWSPARRGTWHGYVYDTIGTRSLCGTKYLWPPRGVFETHELASSKGAQVCRTCLRVVEQCGYLEVSA